MDNYFVRRSGQQSDFGRDIEIMIENVSRCVWCTVPTSWFLYSFFTRSLSVKSLRVDRKRLYMYKKNEHFEGF